MKKLSFYIAAVLMIALLSSCSAGESGHQSVFSATVIEVTDTTVKVRPFDGTAELRSADEITFAAPDEMPVLRVGDDIRIAYDGEIAETYPAQLGKVFAVYHLDNTGRVVR